MEQQHDLVYFVRITGARTPAIYALNRTPFNVLLNDKRAINLINPKNHQ
ncbi:MAG: hypothetical protein LBH74_07925 [Nitrososphaerota archaeon]|nr:hypothetical protein [Nitrososphaerota archaeon]